MEWVEATSMRYCLEREIEMPRRSKTDSPEKLRQELVELLTDFEQKLMSSDIRKQVKTLIPAHRKLRDLGSSLIPVSDAVDGKDSANKRILAYFQKYCGHLIKGEELMVVAGISEWARRVRELRKEHGWRIVSGVTVKQMGDTNDMTTDGYKLSELKTDHYVLLSLKQDLEAANRWHIANSIRKSNTSVRDKILTFLREYNGKEISGEELRYVADNKTEWARRVRELRTEEGWPIQSKTSGRPDLPVGVYVLEEDRQSPEHDRTIPDPVRRKVLQRDNYTCTACNWNHDMWNPSDPRHLELHHKEHHARGGDNTEENLITLCTVCHDDIHRKEGQGKRKQK